VANILNQSWILINTASREGLPNSFIKAASHQCAKIRAVNQDGFAREFGFHVKDDNFLAALDFLLSDNRWQQKGLQGYKYGKNAMNKMGRSANTMKFIETYRGFSNAYTSFTHRYRCC